MTKCSVDMEHNLESNGAPNNVGSNEILDVEKYDNGKKAIDEWFNSHLKEVNHLEELARKGDLIAYDHYNLELEMIGELKNHLISVASYSTNLTDSMLAEYQLELLNKVYTTVFI